MNNTELDSKFADTISYKINSKYKRHTGPGIRWCQKSHSYQDDKSRKRRRRQKMNNSKKKRRQLRTTLV